MDITEIKKLLADLTREYEALLQERELVRAADLEIKKRHEAMGKKIEGLQQSLQGLSLYLTAQDEAPPRTGNAGEPMPEQPVPGETTTSTTTPTYRIPALEMKKKKTLIESCREILHRHGDWIPALEVRQALYAAGFDFSEYKSNPLSSIHTTLKRIAESGQAWSHHELSAGENLYRWKKSGEIAPPPFGNEATGISATRTKTA